MTQHHPDAGPTQETGANVWIEAFDAALLSKDMGSLQKLAREAVPCDESVLDRLASRWYKSAAWCVEAMQAVAVTGAGLPESMEAMENIVEECVHQNAPASLRFVLEDLRGKAILNESYRLEPAIITASRRCQWEMLETFMACGVTVGPSGGERRSPLHRAVAGADSGDWGGIERFERTVDLLLAHGAAIDHFDSEGQSPLTVAARLGKPDRFACLLARGADPYAGVAMTTPISVAARKWEFGILEQLQAAGLDLRRANAKGGDASTLLHVAAVRADQTIDGGMISAEVFKRTVDVLRGAGLDIDARDSMGMTPLLRSLLIGDGARIRVLLEAGARLDARDNRGQGVEEHLALIDENSGKPTATANARAVIHAWRARSSLDTMMAALGRPASPAP